MCAKNNLNIFGQIVGGGVLDAPDVQLSEYGIIAEKYITAIRAHYEHIKIDKHVIMPNHIHMIISANISEGQYISSPTNAIIPSLISSFKRLVNKECESSLFQRSYHDYIIRNLDDYLRIWKYIDENPHKWVEDRYYSRE